MKPKPIFASVSALFCAAVILAASRNAFARPTANDIIKDESEVKRMAAVYPLPEAVIGDTLPMVTVDFSKLEVPVDLSSVVITINGAAVTADSEVNPVYAVYKPEKDLAPGDYEVRVTASDANHAQLEPLAWRFTISEQLVKERLAAMPKSERTTGQLVTSTDYVSARYTPQRLFNVADQFREKEGMKTSGDLTFSNSSDGRKIVGSLHRETQAYSGTVIDKGRLQYSDGHFLGDVGSYWMQWSDLTLLGAEVTGVRFQKDFGSNRIQVISGRTQNNNISGDFNQNTTGIRYDITKGKNKLGFIAMKADEKGDATSIPGSPPSHDTLFSVLDEFTISDNINSSLEIARSFRKTLGFPDKTKNDAYKFGVNRVNARLTGEASLYRIGHNYMPVSEGSAKFLMNDRKGYRLNAGYKLFDWLKFGGEHEQFDTMSTLIRTKRDSLFSSLTHNTQSLTWRKTKLTTDPAIQSDTQGVTYNFSMKRLGPFGGSQLSAGWMDFAFKTPNLNADNRNFLYSLNSSYRHNFVFSASSNVGDYNETLSASSVTSRDNKTAMTWAVMPGKLALTSSIEALTSKGTGADNREYRKLLGLKRTLNSTYSLNLNYESISHIDSVSSAYDYVQRILRAGTEWNF